MRSRHMCAGMFVWIMVLTSSWAAAGDAQDAMAARLTAGDAHIIVTDARGVIVGVGRVVAGAGFELRFLDGFAGPARLTLLRPDGATEVLDIVVDVRLRIEGLDLLELLAERVEAFIVEVGGVAYHAAERARTGAGDEAGEGPRHAEPPRPTETPGPPGSPGHPGSSPPRGSDGRP